MNIPKKLIRILITAALLTAFLAIFALAAYAQGPIIVNSATDKFTGDEQGETVPPEGLSGEAWTSIQSLMREAQYHAGNKNRGASGGTPHFPRFLMLFSRRENKKAFADCAVCKRLFC